MTTAGAVLAIDTATPVGSVVVARDDVVLGSRLLERRAEHAASLLPAIDDVLRDAGVSPGELSAVVVGEGPGSFTGIRVAAATAKGLAHALALPLRPVSSLAGAVLAVDAGGVRYALFDARRDRVYGACYEIEARRVRVLVEPHAGRLDDVLAGPPPTGATFVGDGAERHRGRIEDAGFTVSAPERPPVLAEGLLRFLAGAPASAPAPDPASWEPRYLRPWSPDAAWVG